MKLRPLCESYLRRGSLDKVVDEVPLLVTHDHPCPLVWLQPEGLEGELLKEVHPRIPRFTHKLHLVSGKSTSKVAVAAAAAATHFTTSVLL